MLSCWSKTTFVQKGESQPVSPIQDQDLSAGRGMWQEVDGELKP